MKIYLVSQDENDSYDTFDSFICYANNEDEARTMSPREEHFCKWDDKLKKHTRCDWFDPECYNDEWASSLDNVKVEYLGEASSKLEPAVILASYNAG